jgi:hypothetical protein
MNDGQPLLEKLEDLFGDEPFGPVEEELYQWFLFAYDGKGKGINDLDTLDLEIFKGRLAILIDGVYQWQRE